MTMTRWTLALSLFPVDSGPKGNKALSKQETRKVIDLLLSLPHGVMGMSPDFEGLVETSNNLATTGTSWCRNGLSSPI